MFGMSRRSENYQHYRQVRQAWAVLLFIALMLLVAVGYYWNMPS